MFGYVKVNSAELKVKEYEIYRGAYCGLCRSMGKCTGQCSRMALSYDFVFLVMTRLCLTDTNPSFSQRRCLAHPLKRRSVMDRNSQLDLCAYAAAVLSYHKTKDDLADERGLKRLRARITYPLVRSWRKKALKSGFSDLDQRVEKNLRDLAELEKKLLPSVDAPAEIFGKILADITSYGLEGAQEKIARTLGHCVGKWIYIIDALDDMSEDIKKGRYNPLVLLYGGNLPTPEQLSTIKDALKLELVAAEAAMDLVECEKLPIINILENTLYLGMPDVAEKIICGKDCHDVAKNTISQPD